MAGDPLIDVYKLDAGDAPEVWKQLEELAKKFSAALTITQQTSDELATRMKELGDSSIETERALKEHGETLKGVERETRKAAEAQKSMADFLNEDLQRSLLSTQAQYELLKEAIKAAGELVKDGVKDYFAAEQSSMRLGFALNNAGIGGSMLATHLEELGEKLERTTGQSAEFIRQLEQTALQLGVAPEKTERFTRGALDLAAATGTDAKNALMIMARANAEGKDELKKWGIAVDEAAFATKGFDAVLDEVEKKVGGTAETMSAQMSVLNELSAAWGDLKKAIGQVVVSQADQDKGWRHLAEQLDWVSEKLTGNLKKANEEYAKKTAENTQITDQLVTATKALQFNEQQLADYRASHPNGPYIADLQAAVDKTQAEVDALEKKRAALLGISQVKKPEAPSEVDYTGALLTDLSKSEEDAENRRKQIREAAARHAEETARVEQRLAEQRKKAFDELNEEDFKKFETQKKQSDELMLASDDLWRTIAENDKKGVDDLVGTLEQAGKEVDSFLKERAEERKQVWTDVRADLQGFGMEAATTFADMAREQILTNNQFSAEYRAASVDRQAADKAEAAARKQLGDAKFDQMTKEEQKTQVMLHLAESKAQVEARTAEAEKAAFAVRTAGLLANIGQEAAIKAALQGAEAVASLAIGDAAGATNHAIAAGLYAAVAGAAGGAAYAITQSRGKTADEQAQLDALNKRDQDRASRSAANDAQTGQANGGPTINQYVLGISGFTELEQANRLEELRREGLKRATGNG